MFLIQNILATLPGIAFLLFSGAAACAHPFHFSSAEMQWNEKNRTFEVSLKLDPNDFEQELRKRTKKKLVLEKMKTNDLVFEYIKDVFQVEMKNKRLPIKPIGFEVETKAAWVYFEIPVTDEFGDLKMTNQILQHTPHQTNTLLFQFGKHKQTFRFNEEKTAQKLTWDAYSKTYVFGKNN